MPTPKLPNAYQLPAVEHPIIQQNIDVASIIAQLSTFISKNQLSAGIIQTDLRPIVEEQLHEHIGENATYSKKSKLIASIQQILAYMNNGKISTTVCQNIAVQLHEDLDQCTQGFHNRCEYVLQRLYIPNSIEAFLERIRFEIAEPIVSRISQDIDTDMTDDDDQHKAETVHITNAFFHKISLAYGIFVPNRDDIHLATFADEITNNDLQKFSTEFTQKYTALTILQRLPVLVRETLVTHFDYQGYQRTSYEAGKYLHFYDLLKSVLDMEAIPYPDIFICGKNDEIFDINWRFFTRKMYAKIISKDYFDFESEIERKLFDILYVYSEQAVAKFQLNQAPFRSIIKSLRLIDYPVMIRNTSQSQQRQILDIFSTEPKKISNYSPHILNFV